jgi:hypothetical protein
MSAILDGLPFPVLLADGQAIRNVMRGLQHRQQEFDSSGLTTALLIFCLFFVAVWGVARLFVRSEGEAAQNSSRALLAELCRAHRLTRRDTWFLGRLARHHRLPEPAVLFLDPRWLDPAQCGPAWRQHAARLRDLQRTLFAGLASPVPDRRTG